jgi:hypothetical protein
MTADFQLGVKRWGKTLEHLLLGKDPDLAECLDTEPRISVLQGYREGGLVLHLHVRVRPRRTKADSHDFCAVMGRSPCDIPDIGRKDLANVSEVAKGENHPALSDRLGELGGDERRLKEPVFVRVVEFFKLGEGVERTEFWTPIERLRPLYLSGKFAHHLRATLDELVWQLVLMRGSTPRLGAGGTAFPILDSEGKWQARRTQDALGGVLDEDRAQCR